MSIFAIPDLDFSSQQHHQWGQLYGCSYALAILETAQSIQSPLLVIMPSNQQLDELLAQLHFFRASDDLPILLFPDWETLPYDAFSPHQDITSQRLETLYTLPRLKQGIVITTAATLMQRIAPPEYVQSHTLVLRKNQQLHFDSLRKQLDDAGYYSVSKVTRHGEFAIRGSLIDLFPTGSRQPYRLNLFDDEIESIRTFDADTQLSVKEIDAIQLLAAREYPLDEDSINRFRQAFRRQFSGNPKNCPLYVDISNGFASSGAEYYLPLFFTATATLFDYLSNNTTLMVLDDALTENDYFTQVEERYEAHRYDAQRPVLPPAQLYIDADELNQRCAALNRIDLRHRAIHRQRGNAAWNLGAIAIPDIKIHARAAEPAQLLRRFMQSFDGRILFTAESAGQREILQEILTGFNIRTHYCNSWQDFLNSQHRFCLTVAPFSDGVHLRPKSIAIITSQQIQGRRSQQLSSHRRKRQAENILHHLGELHVGSLVVYEREGVGRYLGLEIQSRNGYAEEFLALEYAGGDKLYIPVGSLHLISRYHNDGGEGAISLHRLGTGQWQNIKRKAAEKIRDVAVELLEVYARREARPGYAYPFDSIEYDTFAASFPFVETEDQHHAIQAVITDMQKNSPMDRVVCGDVGFGKTEVAIRAAYIAAQVGKQTAILTPTTLLSQQHYQNFRDRFADWPVNVDVLSRFRNKQETTQVLKQLADGKIDIIIGTHRLLQKDVHFKNLGLLIIDEEHRFGVRQKEQIKKFRSEVDMLTLTATPIPRTLNMSLSGLRDLSIISTPPMQRLSVKTFINEWSDLTVQEACLREIKRGGQVYFLHNKVSNIEEVADNLRKLVPQAQLEIAHGQMRERELESIMLDFYRRKFNILVCTTIIESGIDVPTANTILINQADKFGLAQLHQLRGRVGRSHHQAYAYLIVPQRNAMKDDAIKRIEAVAALEDLGAGFSLASQDLEIRGAGELLGEEQSGNIMQMGFTLYTDLLNRTVAALKSGKIPQPEAPTECDPEINLHIPALLPDDYLADIHMRLVLYKRIAHAENDEELRTLQVEMIDRFGLLPDTAKNFFKITALKIRAKQIGISKIAANETDGRVVFIAQPHIDPMAIISLIQQAPQTYRLDGKHTLRFTLDMPTADERLRAIDHLMQRLTTQKAA